MKLVLYLSDREKIRRQGTSLLALTGRNVSQFLLQIDLRTTLFKNQCNFLNASCSLFKQEQFLDLGFFSSYLFEIFKRKKNRILSGSQMQSVEVSFSLSQMFELQTSIFLSNEDKN